MDDPPGARRADAAGAPRGLLLRRSPPRRSPTATSTSRPNAERALTRETLAGADVLVIAHPSDPRWEATTNARAPRLSDRELDAIEEFVRGGGGLIALGETEQAKYGNNLNDLLARFGIEVANCTVQDYEHHLSAPSWVLAELENGADGEHDSVDLLARVQPGLLLPRRHPGAPQRRPRDRAQLAHRFAAAGAPRRDHPARRRPRRGARRLRPVRRRLHRRARQRVAVAQPRLLGGAARLRRRADRDRLAGPLRPELGGAQGRRRGAAPDPGARRLGRPVRARGRPPHRARRDDLERLPPPGAPLPPPDGLHRRPASGPARLGRLRLRQARLRSLPGGVPAGARPARRGRAPGRLPDVQAERLARHLLRGADRARPLAGLRRRARALRLRQPEVRPAQLRRLHRGLRLRVRRALPRDLLHGGAPAELLRGHLLRPRGGALSPRLRPRRRAPAAQPAARRRLPS